jgi:hypothetical protein
MAGCRPGTGQGGACELCGRPGTPDDPLQADHIVAVGDGGGDEVLSVGIVLVLGPEKSAVAIRASRSGQPCSA